MTNQQRGAISFPSCQETGNPVFDSLVNISMALASAGSVLPASQLEALHAVLLKLALQEPGGYVCRDGNGTLLIGRETLRERFDSSPSSQ